MNKGQSSLKQFSSAQKTAQEGPKIIDPLPFHPMPNWHKGLGISAIEKIDEYMLNTFLPKHPKLDIYKDSDASDDLEMEVINDNTVEINYFFLLPDDSTEIMIPVQMTNIEKMNEMSADYVEWDTEKGIVKNPTKFIVVSNENEPEFPISSLDKFIDEHSGILQ